MTDQKKLDDERARTALVAAVKAGCQVKIEDYRSKRVAMAITHCGYPLCKCRILPAQIEAALKAHQEVEIARWRAETATMREPSEDDLSKPSPLTMGA